MENLMICTPHQILFVYSKENAACEAYCMNEEGRRIQSCSGKSWWTESTWKAYE